VAVEERLPDLVPAGREDDREAEAREDDGGRAEGEQRGAAAATGERG
jgi:hypothetical protein